MHFATILRRVPGGFQTDTGDTSWLHSPDFQVRPGAIIAPGRIHL